MITPTPNGMNHAIIIADDRLQAVAKGVDYGAEINILAQEIGNQRVHAEITQPAEATSQAAHIEQIKTQPHQQETKPAGEQRHTAAPDMLDNRDERAHRQSDNNQEAPPPH